MNSSALIAGTRLPPCPLHAAWLGPVTPPQLEERLAWQKVRASSWWRTNPLPWPLVMHESELDRSELVQIKSPAPCPTFPMRPGGSIAHLADFRFGYLASTFSVRPPQNPKDLGFRVFSPFALRWCRPFGLKTPASCRTENHDLPVICLQPTKNPFFGFLR